MEYEMNKAKIAENLRNLRKKKGITSYELAKAIDVTPQAITMYETGERIPRDEVKLKLAKYFKKSVDSIFFV